MIETYGEDRGKVYKKHHWKILIFLVFVIIAGLIAYPIFSGKEIKIPFTGGTIGLPNSNSSSIKAELTIPSLDLDYSFSKIEFTGGPADFIYAGNQKFDLSKTKNNIIAIENFDGKISFNNEQITILDGKAQKASINGISVEPAKNGMKIYFKEPVDFVSLDVDDALIKNLNYQTSGIIEINNKQIILNINYEEVKIQGFLGKIKIREDKFFLDGWLNKLEVSGNSRVIVG